LAAKKTVPLIDFALNARKMVPLAVPKNPENRTRFFIDRECSENTYFNNAYKGEVLLLNR